MNAETIVISVGGSLIVPDDIDTEFLKHLRTLLEKQTTKNDKKFVVITGGGKTSRKYAGAAEKLDNISVEELDEIGIAACQLNAHIVRLALKGLNVSVNPDLDFYTPGSSSDGAAVRTALRHSATKVINLTNIDYVYTDDPKKNPDAQKIEDITWTEFRKLIPEEWSPNLSSPFDPMAAKMAHEKGIEVASINGGKLEELAKYLDGKEFVGTVIN